jgi:nitrate/nitrite-specific signal transduction histidine kinase
MQRREFLVLTAASLPAMSWAQITDINEAINKAGRQRMLSQRMSKAWLARLDGTDYSDIPKVLTNSVTLFESQLTELRNYAPNADLKDTYARLIYPWAQFKELLTSGAPVRSKAQTLLQMDAQVLSLAHQGTQQYEALSGKPAGKLVNMAGRQRMLSQRMAKYFFSAHLDVQTQEAQKELSTARTEFIAAMQTLKKAPESTLFIRNALDLVEGQWVFFDAALQRLGDKRIGKRQLSDVFASSEAILVEMDRITGLYAALKS